ncbi:MAG: S-adenosylmethionine:tRNA ribosyltransferase-isomerase [Bacteroidetes bacterium]|nr:MAG: S-adenosylmethionine:tRNA ribosyltransferase-isomerase [Bacteroidota bacterium]
MLFWKPSGAAIEIFCLGPVEPSNDFQLAFQQPSPVVWKCLVGNVRRWKNETLELKIEDGEDAIILKAEKKSKEGNAFLISFSWAPEHIQFSEIIGQTGQVPLPPYLNRKAEEADKERYQTIYARQDGSVAAPTAGLHFTDSVFNELDKKGIESEQVTLHVGAGTFKPVSSETIAGHEMHTEHIVVPVEALKHMYRKFDDHIIAVGTTSLRTIESLYWMAVKLSSGDESFKINQWDPYDLEQRISGKKALETLIDYATVNGLKEIKGQTQMMIAPGYRLKLARGLLTNFHQPKSTLLLLVATIIGDKWKAAYKFALQNGFRFLSYGDSCLFLYK